MDDYIGGGSYNNKQSDEQLKTKKLMKIIAVIILILLLVSAGLIGLIYYIQVTELKISVDNVSNTTLKDILIFENDKVYVPIRAFASVVGYSSANGGYKQYSEDTTKCYVESADEVASFELNSNKIYKIVLDGHNNNEYYEIDEPVILINNQLCTTMEGAEIAFNISMSYDEKNNKVSINTLPYLVKYYTQKFQNSAIADTEAKFSNQKALLYNMIIVKDANGRYGVSDLKGNEIIGTKYASLEFIESSKDFSVTTVENKMGIVSYDGRNKINPDYDNVKQIDKDNGLYLVTSNGKNGVVNENGSIVLYLEFDQIGIDVSRFPANDIKNQYLLYDKCIPVKRNNLWGLYDKTGKQITQIKYTQLGCTQGSGNSGDRTANNLVLLPEYEGVVVQENNYYGVIDSAGKELIPSALQSAYFTITSGEITYYMIYRDELHNMGDYIENILEQNETTNNTETNTNTETGTSTENGTGATNLESQNTTNSTGNNQTGQNTTNSTGNINVEQNVTNNTGNTYIEQNAEETQQSSTGNQVNTTTVQDGTSINNNTIPANSNSVSTQNGADISGRRNN